MTKAELEEFKKKLLESEREMVIKKASRTLAEEAQLDVADLPDEIDQASAEYNQSFTFRLRDREKYYLSKIEKALVKLREGTFGICEECEEPISLRRMQARPVTTLCIRCKREQKWKSGPTRSAKPAPQAWFKITWLEQRVYA